jgi:uncharacterized RDD family membrane protein YckC
MAKPQKKPKAAPAPISMPTATPGRVRDLVTPEGVDLRLNLASAGERAGALLIDLGIMMLAVIVVSVLALAAGFGALSDKHTRMAEAVGVIWLLGLFLLRNLYFIGFEMSPRAATPGKRMLGLRVASRNGGRLTADAVFARNFMRELEVYLPLGMLFSSGVGVDGWLKLLGVIWCGIFVLFPLFNRDRLRVGDLVAGTWVIKAPRRKLLRDLSDDGVMRLGGFAFSPAQVDAYGVHELHVLEDVLRRGDKRTLGAVADRIRLKIEWTRGGDELDTDFLSAYYAALRRRLEQRLLFGHRRKDKHDKS